MAKSSIKTTSKKTTQKKSSRSSWLGRFTRAQLIVISVFVLVFASLGSWMLYKSYAAAWYCSAHEYYQYEPGTYQGNCVYQIQYALIYVGELSGNSTMKNTSYDGIYGPGTAASVKAFQNWWNVKHRGQPVVTLYPDGVIGSATWNALCPTVKGYTGIYNALGCYHTPYGSARV